MHSPNSKLYLLKGVPIKDYKNQIDFKDVSTQTQYFLSKVAMDFADQTEQRYSYVRQHNSVKVPYPVDKCQEVSYAMYQNKHYGDKWFYAFVRQAVYISEEVTELYLEEDAWQTWCFDITIQKSFVERTHVLDDTVGKNIVDEGLSTGEYVTQTEEYMDFSSCWVVVQATVDLRSESFVPISSTLMDGVYSGLGSFIYDPTGEKLASVLSRLASAGKSDAIVGMYMLPRATVGRGYYDGDRVIRSTLYANTFTFSAPSEDGLGLLKERYLPKNKKLYCYPYRAFVLGATSGGTVTFKPELVQTEGETLQIALRASIAPSGSVIAYPVEYGGTELGINYKVELSQYPQCQWIKDNYMNWLASANIRTKWDYTNNDIGLVKNMATTGVNALGQLANLKPMSALNTALSGTANNLIDYTYTREMIGNALSEEKEVHALIPPSANGTSSGATLIGCVRYGIYATVRTITASYAKILDDYFTMYGYKVNELMDVDYKTRPYFNYIKTVGVNITGNINNLSMDSIRTMFDTGVTFWHEPTQMYNYSLDNRPGGGASPEPVPTPTPRVSVSIVGGKGSGSYNPGDKIEITADDAEDFSEWAINPDNDKSGYFEYVNVTPTIYTVGTVPVTITALAKTPEPEPEPIPDETIADLMEKDIGAVEWDETVGKIQRWYYGSYVKDHWCTTSVTYYAHMGGWSKACPKNANVDGLFNKLKKLYLNIAGDGWWRTKNYGGTNTMPKRGDLIFFSGGHTTSDLTHVGCVTSVSGTSITYVSGNTSNPTKGKPDGIFEKTLDITDRYVVCFCALDYFGA